MQVPSESVTSKTVRTAWWSGVQKISTIGIRFVVTMVLARLLTPADYGTVALLTVFFTISAAVADCGFGTALIRKLECTQSDYSTAFYFNIAVGAFVYFLLFFAAPYIALFYEVPILCVIMRVSGLSVFFDCCNIVQHAQLTRNLEFKKNALITLSSFLVSGIVAIIFAYRGAGVWALVIQGVLSSFLRTSFTFLVVKWWPSLKFSKESLRYLWDFGSKILFTGIIGNIYDNIYSIVIGKFYNSAILGTYNRGHSLAMLAPSIVSGVFTANTLPIMAPLQNDRERLIAVYRKYIVLVSFLNIPFCVLMSALAEPFILFFLSEKWAASVIYVQIFSLSAITSSAGFINLNLILVKGRTDILLKIEIIKKSIGFLIVALLVFVSPMALAVGSSLFNIFCYVINLYCVNKLFNLPYGQQMSDLTPALVSSVIAGCVAYAVTFVALPIFVQLVAGGLLGILSYFLMTKIVYGMDIYDSITAILMKKKA